MSEHRHKVAPAVYLILEVDGHFLFLRRQNTTFYEGYYSVVAGHAEQGETIRSAMAREAYEEANIQVNPQELNLLHIMSDPANNRIHFFFRPRRWEGPLQNNEPHKADVLDWFPRGAPPQPFIPFVDRVLRCIDEGVWDSENASEVSNYHGH